MKIHLERSGGFAGMTSSTTVDTKALAPNDANELQTLIHKSNLFEHSANLLLLPKQKQKKEQPITLHTKLLFKMEIWNDQWSAMISICKLRSKDWLILSQNMLKSSNSSVLF